MADIKRIQTPVDDELQELNDLAEAAENIMEPIGASGTQYFKGLYNIKDADEHVNQLSGSKALETYYRMFRSDAQVAMIINSIKQPIQSAYCSIEPPGDPKQGDDPTPQEVEATKIISDLFFSESTFNFKEFLQEATDFLYTGFYPFEKIWKVSSSGHHYVDNLASRLPSTIKEWFIDEGGSLTAVKQRIDGGIQTGEVVIPANKLLYFAFAKKGGDFRGSSVLRHAYKHWYYKDSFYKLQAVALERQAVGIPVVKLGENATNAQKKRAIADAQNLRAHERSYLVLPDGISVEMLDMKGNNQMDPSTAISHHDTAIAKSVLAQFLELGLDGVGSRSLGETQKSMFLGSIQWVADFIANAINEQVIWPMSRLNFGEEIRPPKLSFTGIDKQDLSMLAQAYSTLGINVVNDEKVQSHVRDVLDLPAYDSEASESVIEPQAQPQMFNKHIKATTQVEGMPNNRSKEVGSGEEAFVSVYQPWRELRPEEDCMRLREISGRLDDASEEIVRVNKAAQEKAVDELLPQIKEAFESGSPKDIKKIDVSNDILKDIQKSTAKVLTELYEFGQEQVSKEFKRSKEKQAEKQVQLKFDKRKPRYEPKNAKEVFDADALQNAEVFTEKLVNAARAFANAAVLSGLFDVSKMKDDLLSFSLNTLRQAAKHPIAQAFNFGRKFEATKLEDEISHAVYTAILDQGVCGPCAEQDGKEVEVGSPLYEQISPPLSAPVACEGGTKCRCTWVYVFKDEVEAEA